MKSKIKITKFVLRIEDRFQACKIELMKQTKSPDQLKADASLSQISFKMLTADFARAGSSRNVFCVLTPVPLQVKPGDPVFARQTGFSSRMLTGPLLGNNTECCVFCTLRKHSKTQHLLCQTEVSPCTLR